MMVTGGNEDGRLRLGLFLLVPKQEFFFLAGTLYTIEFPRDFACLTNRAFGWPHWLHARIPQKWLFFHSVQSSG
jgi:hypothetical protein